MLVLVVKHLNTAETTKEKLIGGKKFFEKIWPQMDPPGVPHFGALRALVKNRLDACSNLAHRSMHAKFQLIWPIHLARAMGVVRNLPPHLIFGGYL